MNFRRLILPLGALLFTNCFDVVSKTCVSGLVCPIGSVCSGDGSNCIASTATCGNGVIDALTDGSGMEKCDDGNVTGGDDCRSDCKGSGKCGDGTLDPATGEACDDGNRVQGDGCNLQCLVERCGNGIVDVIADGGTEPCDDGNNVQGDGCRSNCSQELCGDTQRDVFIDGGAEMCDDGNLVDGDDCSATCKLENCGNNIVDVLHDGGTEECDNPTGACGLTCLIVRCGNSQLDNATTGRGQGGEKCDDGNVLPGDGCNARCNGLEECGDNVLDAVLKDGGFEICDDGNRDAGDGCSANCRSNETCSNGITDVARGELCDDRNLVSGDGCRQDCKGLELCGDNFRDALLVDGGTEQCDDGNTIVGDGCSPTCRFEVCGNGIRDPNELCDDGNTAPIGPNDNCSSDCRATGACGNGTVETGLSEQCDDALLNNDNAACTSTCQIARCGDALVRTGIEQCDTRTESLTCNVNCTTRRCGDGIINATAGEQCDVFGAVTATETSACDTDCTVAFCGDSKVNLVLSEQCDTGGNTNACNSNCRPALCGDNFLNTNHGTAPDGGAPFEQCDTGGNSTFCDNDCSPSVCGDGLFNSAAGEQCDDGNSSNIDDCVTGCRSNVCGDGFRDQLGPSIEACDDGNTVAETTCAYNLRTCSGCSANCGAVITNLTGPYCGDGATSASNGEGCDDSNNITETACPYGTASCFGCTANCAAQYSLTGPRCGDNVTNGANGEVCDDGNQVTEPNCPYGTPTCTVCANDCLTQPAKVGFYCGDGTISGSLGEACDDGARNGATACLYGQATCNICNANCSALIPRTGERCGDGVVNGSGINAEFCDDGNTTTETSCPYGQATCNPCNANCTAAPLRTGSVCGDGVVNPPNEQCDDHNTLACGTCSANCGLPQTPIEATGLIRTISDATLNNSGDGQTFTLNDGVNPPTTFCFKLNDAGFTCDGGQVTLDFTATSPNDSQVADAVINAVNLQPGTLLITATKRSSNPYVRLTNDAFGNQGNQPLVETVVDTGWVMTGMSGGTAADCLSGVGCVTNNDCASGSCAAPTDGGTLNTCL